MALLVTLLIIFFVLFFQISETYTFSHWIVTENGKIEAKANGAFPLWRSNDLIALMHQEERIATLAVLTEQLNSFKLSLDSRWLNLNLDTDMEQKLYSDHPDCLNLDKPLSKYELNPVFFDYSAGKRPVRQDIFSMTLPDCRQFYPLEFSLFTLPHLKTLRERENISIVNSNSVFNVPFNVLVNEMFLNNITDWTAYNLAAIYWTYAGNGSNALECLRRAVHLAPRGHRALVLNNLGALLQAVDSLGESAIVFHMAVDHARTNYKYHLALGHIYTLLGDYNRAAGCYSNVLSLAPTLTWVAQLRIALICQKHLEEGLQVLHTSLKQVLNELSEYIKVQEKWIAIYNEIRAQRAGHFSLNLPMDHLQSLWRVVEFQEQQLTKRMSQKASKHNRMNGHSEKNHLKVKPLFDCDAEDCPNYIIKIENSVKPVKHNKADNVFEIISYDDSSSVNYDNMEMKNLRLATGDQPFWQDLKKCLQNDEISDKITDCLNQPVTFNLQLPVQENNNNLENPIKDEELLDESVIENYVNHDHSKLPRK